MAVVATPALVIPAMKAAAWLPAVSGSWPYSRRRTPIGWLVASVPGGTTSATGAKSRFTPADRSCSPHSFASAVSVPTGRPPWTRAEGIVEKPGPWSAWISPPSWFAAMKKRTWAVAAEVAWAWTASATARIPATPIEVVAVNQTEPTCWFRIALSSAAPSRLLARPSEKSWPIR